ncbi:hypothetical protein CP8484711_0479B, partial [Chlamydia psittaci 84-8471/1]
HSNDVDITLLREILDCIYYI